MQCSCPEKTSFWAARSITITAARDQPRRVYDAIAQVLDDPRLHAALRRVVRDLFRRYPALSAVRVRLSR
jgi:hypothetical protein